MEFASSKKEGSLKTITRYEKNSFTYYLVILIVFYSSLLYSSDKIKISGKIADAEANEPIIQASIRIKGAQPEHTPGWMEVFRLLYKVVKRPL